MKKNFFSDHACKVYFVPAVREGQVLDSSGHPLEEDSVLGLPVNNAHNPCLLGRSENT